MFLAYRRGNSGCFTCASCDPTLFTITTATRNSTTGLRRISAHYYLIRGRFQHVLAVINARFAFSRICTHLHPARNVKKKMCVSGAACSQDLSLISNADNTEVGGGIRTAQLFNR